MRKNWTDSDQILALNLYHMLPFGRLSETTAEIKALAAQRVFKILCQPSHKSI